MEDSGPDDTDAEDSGPDDTDTEEDSGPCVIVESSENEAEDSDIDVETGKEKRKAFTRVLFSYFLTPPRAIEGLWS